MDPEAALGVAVSARRIVIREVASCLLGLGVLLTVAPPVAAAGPGYALIVTGASGGSEYAQKYDQWRTSLVATLSGSFGYPDDHLIVLAEQGEPGVREANRENVLAALDVLRRRAGPDDVVLVILIGHGTVFEGEDAKFNLVGADLSVDDWEAGIRPIAAALSSSIRRAPASRSSRRSPGEGESF